MVDSNTFRAYISRNSAHAICLSFLTARMMDLHCCQFKIHGLPMRGWFSRDWWSVARATKLRTVDQGRLVIRLIAAKEYRKKKRTIITPFSARDIPRLAVWGIVGCVASLQSHNPIFLMQCARTESPRLLRSDRIQGQIAMTDCVKLNFETAQCSSLLCSVLTLHQNCLRWVGD